MRRARHPLASLQWPGFAGRDRPCRVCRHLCHGARRRCHRSGSPEPCSGEAPCPAPSEHLRRWRDDLHVVAIPQFTGNGAKDSSSPGIALIVDKDRSILVEADVATVRPAIFLGRPNDDCPHDVALLDGGVGDRLLDAGDDHVTDLCDRLSRAAHDPNALERSSTGVVGDSKSGVLLDHCADSRSAMCLPGCAEPWIASSVSSLSTIGSDVAPSPAREITLISRQRLVAERGRDFSIRTESPTRASLASSCALNLLVCRMTRLYSGWRVMRSTDTTIVLSILSLTTRPTLVFRLPCTDAPAIT